MGRRGGAPVKQRAFGDVLQALDEVFAMRSIGLLVVGGLLALAPMGCGEDAATSTSGGGASATGTAGTGTGTGTGTGGAAGTTTGGTNTCDETCVVQCDASVFLPSEGSCVGLGGAVTCNPMTNAGCDTVQGEACDVAPGGFRCYPAPNTAALCESCGPGSPGCQRGFTCAPDGVCAKFCCADQDCDGSGQCVTLPGLSAGICQTGGSGPTMC